jgi:hypothetical protein
MRKKVVVSIKGKFRRNEFGLDCIRMKFNIPLTGRTENESTGAKENLLLV